MCLAKPGPRCPGHVRGFLSAARDKAAALEITAPGSPEHQKATEKVRALKHEYVRTSGGLAGVARAYGKAARAGDYSTARQMKNLHEKAGQDYVGMLNAYHAERKTGKSFVYGGGADNINRFEIRELANKMEDKKADVTAAVKEYKSVIKQYPPAEGPRGRGGMPNLPATLEGRMAVKNAQDKVREAKSQLTQAEEEFVASPAALDYIAIQKDLNDGMSTKFRKDDEKAVVASMKARWKNYEERAIDHEVSRLENSANFGTPENIVPAGDSRANHIAIQERFDEIEKLSNRAAEMPRVEYNPEKEARKEAIGLNYMREKMKDDPNFRVNSRGSKLYPGEKIS